MYLGLSERVELPHHSIWFAQNYRRNVREICTSLELSNDPSFYLHNPSVTDPTLAPEGKSALYVLVPVPNLDAKIDWETNRSSFRELVLTRIRERTGLDLAPLIEKEKIITPLDWERDHRVYKGATISLAHSWDQMLQFRPRNEFEEFRGFYLVGGGTHPGSGLPTILESARIAASLIDSRERRSWRRPLALWSKETS
jgi:phytoene desaturase